MAREKLAFGAAELPSVQAMNSLFLKPMPLWKRASDIVGAGTALILLSPLLATAVGLALWGRRSHEPD